MLSDYVLVDPSLWFGFPAELCLLSGVLLPWSYLCETSTVWLQHLWLRWQMKGLFPHQVHFLILSAAGDTLKGGERRKALP